MMKKSILMSLMVMAFGAAYAEQGEAGDSTRAAAQTAGVPVEEGLSNVKGSVESLTESYLETKSTVDKLARIKVSGYIQAQWQYADSNGQPSFAGGNFAPLTKQRFQLRRARLKTQYESATSRYVLQFDVAQTGLAIKDAYVTLMEPWLKTFSGTMGVFNRPFGFEIAYSSSSRESPERSRVFQTLFPGERDMGAMLEIAPPSEMGPLSMLNFKGGVFTGMRENTVENDNEQDFIGRLGFQAPFYGINLSIDGGVSAYMGKVTNRTDTVFESGTGANGLKAMVRDVGGNLNGTVDRNYYGADLQLYYDLPVIGGTSLRGEYLWGEQPGAAGSSSFYPGTGSLYKREFMGWYAMLVQNIFAKNQLVFKYDVYDPNVNADAGDIGKATTAAPVGPAGVALGAADIQISTLGLGWLYHWDENVRLMAYYDMVANEEINANAAGGLATWKQDFDDNIFTFRIQVKF
jgi:hypothetical protein